MSRLRTQNEPRSDLKPEFVIGRQIRGTPLVAAQLALAARAEAECVPLTLTTWPPSRVYTSASELTSRFYHGIHNRGRIEEMLRDQRHHKHLSPHTAARLAIRLAVDDQECLQLVAKPLQMRSSKHLIGVVVANACDLDDDRSPVNLSVEECEVRTALELKALLSIANQASFITLAVTGKVPYTAASELVNRVHIPYSAEQELVLGQVAPLSTAPDPDYQAHYVAQASSNLV